MEVSTVSPPPSPTEGDHLCDIDVTNIAIHIVTLLIGLCGLAGNGAVLWLIGLKATFFFIFGLAVPDFLFLLFAVPSALLFLVENVSCSPILPPVYVSSIFQLSAVSYYWVLFLLVLGSFVLCDECCHIPERLHLMLGFALFSAFLALFTVIPTVASLCPAQEQEHCQVALISINAIILFLFAAPVLISRTINIIKAKCGSRQQQLKRRDIVIFLVVLFILLLGLWNFLQQLGYILVSSQVDFLLTCINSSIKPFIYFLAGRCRRPCSVASLRASLRSVFEEPEENRPSSSDAAMDMVI